MANISQASEWISRGLSRTKYSDHCSLKTEADFRKLTGIDKPTWSIFSTVSVIKHWIYSFSPVEFKEKCWKRPYIKIIFSYQILCFSFWHQLHFVCSDPGQVVSLCISITYHSAHQKVKGWCLKEYRFSVKKKCICFFFIEGYISDFDSTIAHKLYADAFKLWLTYQKWMKESQKAQGQKWKPT